MTRSCECFLHSSSQKSRSTNLSGHYEPSWKHRNPHERSECKRDAERKRDSAQPQERAQPIRAMSDAKVLSSHVVYSGGHIQVREDRIVEPGGKACTREIVVHPGAVC